MTAAGFYHCSVKSVGRSNGRSIVAAAAYRAGVVLLDEITGQFADYRARGGVLDSFILAPENAPSWTHDRARLWNGAEQAEQRANGRLATELELALPHELDAAARKQLLKDFLAPIIDRYGVAADVAIHEPGEGRDHRNIHAHVLITNRRIDEHGFIEKVKGQRKDIGMSGFARGKAGEAVLEIRQQWEQYVNRAYEQAGLDIRVDHRSHKDRGIEQEPTKHLGPVAAEMERREPGSSDRGDLNREIEQRNAALAERAQLEIEAVKVAADLAAERMLGRMEHQAEQNAAQPDYAAAKGRRDDIRPDPSQTFGARADRTTGPEIFDRDEADRRWNEAVAAAGVAYAAAAGRRDDIRSEQSRSTEPTAQPDYAAAKGRVDDIRPDVRMEAQEATARPAEAREAPAHTSAPEPASQPTSEPQRAAETTPTRAATGFMGQMLDAVAERLGSFISYLGDFFFATPSRVQQPQRPPEPQRRPETEQQQRQQAADEQRRREEAARAEAYRQHVPGYDPSDRERQESFRRARELQEAQLQALLRQTAREDAERKLRRERGEERDDDYGRGLERER